MKICTICNQHILGSACLNCIPDIGLKVNNNNLRGVLALSVLLGLGVGCSPVSPTQNMYGVPSMDVDEDGYDDYEDCDDNDPNTYPGAALEDSETDCMTDADGDGYGDANPSDNVVPGTDCDDSDATVNPASENCDSE